ncbi:fumarylacetoacetate hydrolase family protein [Bradyrhizobium sp. WSM1253]|uniref:fumarylacetoacetate hydrolase family protein n=1 Tax=Bradyrhizobium sp. WSM1253 TaxID=319003 RepID=UPI00031259B5|nr:fumarylacetoacetate hydrolase family protein [Bradyrhizobium sp. WSM1253]
MASLPDGGAVLSIQRNPRRLTPQFDGVRQFRQRLPIQNLPFGVFRRTDPAEAPRGGIAIGDMILDVSTCAANFTGLGLYWRPAQFVTHQTSNRCNLETGDLLGSGTVSGTTLGSLGSPLEITACGHQAV